MNRSETSSCHGSGQGIRRFSAEPGVFPGHWLGALCPTGRRLQALGVTHIIRMASQCRCVSRTKFRTDTAFGLATKYSSRPRRHSLKDIAS